MRTESSETGRRGPRTPWYRNSNWLLVVAVIVVGVWTYHIFTQGRSPSRPAAHGPQAARETAAPVMSRVYPKPSSPATVVQFAHASGDRGVARPNDLTVALSRDPKPGDVLVAFGSSGFGCVLSSGWTRIGTDSQGSTALAYHVVKSGDGKTFVPFTTPRANSYTLELIEVAGDPEIVSSPPAGGIYVASTTLTNTVTLTVPQTGGLLLQLDAASGDARNGPPTSVRNTLPPGQTQTLVDRVPSHGWGSELTVRAVNGDAYAAPQPYKIVEVTTFKGHKLPGNIVVGKLIWIGGTTAAGNSSNS